MPVWDDHNDYCMDCNTVDGNLYEVENGNLVCESCWNDRQRVRRRAPDNGFEFVSPEEYNDGQIVCGCEDAPCCGCNQ